MIGQRIGYVRVSSVEQNTDRQLEGQELARTFTDKASKVGPVAKQSGSQSGVKGIDRVSG